MGGRHFGDMEQALEQGISLLDLPEEVLVIIVSMLPFRDLVRMEATSSYFRGLVIKHTLYKRLYRTTIPSYPSVDYLEQENEEEDDRDREVFGCFDTRSTEEEESTALLENLSKKLVISRHYKLKIFSFLKPDHFHCKGSYDYYIQVGSPPSLFSCLSFFPLLVNYARLLQVFQDSPGPPSTRKWPLSLRSFLCLLPALLLLAVVICLTVYKAATSAPRG